MPKTTAPTRVDARAVRVSHDRRCLQLKMLRALRKEFEASGHPVAAEQIGKLISWVKVRRDEASMSVACDEARKWRRQIEA
jgi:hypothetical protein